MPASKMPQQQFFSKLEDMMDTGGKMQVTIPSNMAEVVFSEISLDKFIEIAEHSSVIVKDKGVIDLANNVVFNATLLIEFENNFVEMYVK